MLLRDGLPAGVLAGRRSCSVPPCCRGDSGIKELLLEGLTLARSIKKDWPHQKFVRRHDCIFTKALVPVKVLLETCGLSQRC